MQVLSSYILVMVMLNSILAFRIESLQNKPIVQNDSLTQKTNTYKNLINSLAQSGDKARIEASEYELIELSGFIIDETKTKLGRDFYDSFYQNWNFPDGVISQDIFIKESPPILTSTLLTIQVGDVEVVSFRLSPRVAIAEEYVNGAILEVQNYLLRFSENLKMLEGANHSNIEIY